MLQFIVVKFNILKGGKMPDEAEKVENTTAKKFWPWIIILAMDNYFGGVDDRGNGGWYI